jgi:16S rRNA (cytidine1402-2'-O)-methyltransferase
MTGTLYIVATPIGNLEDISKRALTILGSVDFIVAEDTRRTGRLLERYELQTRMVSGHQHTNNSKLDWILNELQSGKQVALVTDAGTPGIADPGGRLVELAYDAGVTVIPIPGPSALAAILSVTGWENEPALFIGYLPKKKGRQTLLNLIKSADPKLIQTIVLYESPERIGKTLTELNEYVGDRQIVVGRELTKQFEEIIHTSLNEAVKKDWSKKGEYVVTLNIAK